MGADGGIGEKKRMFHAVFTPNTTKTFVYRHPMFCVWWSWPYQMNWALMQWIPNSCDSSCNSNLLHLMFGFDSVIMLCNKKNCIWCEHSFSPNERILSFWVSSDVKSFLLIAMHKLSCAHTSFALEVGEWWDENLVEEERAAVHLYRPGQKATKVIDIPKKDGEREKWRWYKVRSKRDLREKIRQMKMR